MSILGMNHFTVLTSDLDATLSFYCGVLGLKAGRRPPFDFPGAWLYQDEQPILHIIAGRAMPADPTGVLDHMAFSASGLAETVAQLKTAGIRFDLRRQAGGGPWQLFCHDPSGARVELDFDSREPAPESY